MKVKYIINVLEGGIILHPGWLISIWISLSVLREFSTKTLGNKLGDGGIIQTPKRWVKSENEFVLEICEKSLRRSINYVGMIKVLDLRLVYLSFSNSILLKF